MGQGERNGNCSAAPTRSPDCYSRRGVDLQHLGQKGAAGLGVGDPPLLQGPQDAAQPFGEAPDGLAQQHGLGGLGDGTPRLAFQNQMEVAGTRGSAREAGKPRLPPPGSPGDHLSPRPSRRCGGSEQPAASHWAEGVGTSFPPTGRVPGAGPPAALRCPLGCACG